MPDENNLEPPEGQEGEMNNRLFDILSRARDLSFSMDHRYVLTEHIFLEMMKEPDVIKFYLAAKIDIEELELRLLV